MSTNFDNFWHADSTNIGLCQVYPFSTSPNLVSTHYGVKCRCSRLLHDGELLSAAKFLTT